MKGRGKPSLQHGSTLPTRPLTCELALLQEALQERRVREEHLLKPLSAHVEDGIDEETAREVREQGSQVSWGNTEGQWVRLSILPPQSSPWLCLWVTAPPH